MRLHPDYNLALRLAGLIFQILLLMAPVALVVIWAASLLYPAWAINDGLIPLLQWSTTMGAVAIFLVFVGSIWDAL